MRRMNGRLEMASNLHHCKNWYIRYARNLWRYGEHLDDREDQHWSKLLILENRMIKKDPHRLFTPYRSVGRPKLKCDELLTRFFQNEFPHESESHWIHLLAKYNCTELETKFLDFVSKS